MSIYIHTSTYRQHLLALTLQIPRAWLLLARRKRQEMARILSARLLTWRLDSKKKGGGNSVRLTQKHIYICMYIHIYIHTYIFIYIYI